MSNGWNAFDFSVAVVSMAETIVLNAYTAQALGGDGTVSNIPGTEPGGDRGLVAEGVSLPFWLRILRVGRSLRPLRLLDRFAATRRLVQAIASGGAQIIDAALLNTLTLFAFATAARDLFSQRMGQCTDEGVQLRELCRGTYVQEDGDVALRTWLTPTANFDSLLSALGTLSRMIMLEVWSPIMFRSMDISGPNKGPELNKSYYYAFFFIVFIFVVSFILLQLVLGIVLEHLARVSGSADMTSKQRRWLNLQRFVLHFSPAPQRPLLRADFDSPVADSATAAALLNQSSAASTGNKPASADTRSDGTSIGAETVSGSDSDAPVVRGRARAAPPSPPPASDDLTAQHTQLAKQLLGALGSRSASDGMREKLSQPAVRVSDSLSALYPGIQYFIKEGHRRMAAALAGVAMSQAADQSAAATAMTPRSPKGGHRSASGRQTSHALEDSLSEVQGMQRGGVSSPGLGGGAHLLFPDAKLLQRVQRKVATVHALRAGGGVDANEPPHAGVLVGSSSQGTFSFGPAMLSGSSMLPALAGGDGDDEGGGEGWAALHPAHTTVRDAILMDTTVGTDTMGVDALLSPDIQKRKKTRRGRAATSSSGGAATPATTARDSDDHDDSSSSSSGGESEGESEDAAFDAAVMGPGGAGGGSGSLPLDQPLAVSGGGHVSMRSQPSDSSDMLSSAGGMPSLAIDSKPGAAIATQEGVAGGGSHGMGDEGETVHMRRSATTKTPTHMTPRSRKRVKAKHDKAAERLMLKQGPAVAPPCFNRSCRAIAQDGCPHEVFKHGDNAVILCSEGSAAVRCSCCNQPCCVNCQQSAQLSFYKLRDASYRVANHRLFNAFITLCILLNVLVLMMTHYPMNDSFRDGLRIANRVFLGVFAFEVLLKWLGIGLEKYFRESWDVFDFILVAGSIVFEVLPSTFPFGVEAGRVFRVARLARIFRKVPSLRILFDTAVVSLGSLVNITLVLMLWLFVFAVLGMTLFSDLGASRREIHQWPLPHPNPVFAFSLLPSVLNNSACFASGPGFVLGLEPPTVTGNGNTRLGSRLGNFPEQDDDSENIYRSDLSLQEVYAATLTQAERDLVQLFGFSQDVARAQMAFTNWTWSGLVASTQARYTANGTVVRPGSSVPGEASPAPPAVQGVQELSVCETAPEAYVQAVEFAEKVAPFQAINRHNHFRTFGSSILILLRMATGKLCCTCTGNSLPGATLSRISLFVFTGGDWPLIYADTQSFTQATNLYFFSFTLIITLVVLAFYLGSVLENFQQSVSRPASSVYASSATTHHIFTG